MSLAPSSARPTPAPLPSRPTGVALRERHPLAVALTLYGLAAALLTARIGEHPPFVYNWEHYTARDLFAFWDRPSPAILRPIDGLMTGSGNSPLIALPAWVAFHLGGVGLGQLRLAVALIAALAVPLLWALGRATVGPGAALLAAIFLALSPVFLLYGRTATVVGVSLAPTLATAFALLRVAREPSSWRWLLLLQFLLCAGFSLYAPARFLWPLAVILLWREQRRAPGDEVGQRTRALLITTIVLPVALALATRQNPIVALAGYYEGRGEHVLALSVVPQYYGAYLRTPDDEPAPHPDIAARFHLAARLVAQNVGDMARLFLDWGTAPALSDYWNARGRLYPIFLVPFFLIGLARTARRAPARPEDRLLLLLLGGFTLPLLLTSRVHIGRLIFALPFLCLIVARGVDVAAVGLARRLPAPPADRRKERAPRRVWRGLAVALLALTGWATWLDYRPMPQLPNELATVDILRADAALLRERGAGALILDRTSAAVPLEVEEEERRVADLRLHLDTLFRFSKPTGGASTVTAGTTRPTIYFGALLDALHNGRQLPSPCATVYYVSPAILDETTQLLREQEPGCSLLIRPIALP